VTPRRIAKTATTSLRNRVSNKVSEHFGYDKVILFPYARTAFHSILTSLNLPKGSEILLTPITIAPMLQVIKALGHKPVFVDIELETFCADIEDLKTKLKKKPGCFLLTYLFGYVPDIETIARLCRQNGTPLVEDISHNIGASYNDMALGTFGTAAIYSASLLKYVDAYNGAFIAVQDQVLAKKLEKEVSKYTKPNPSRIAKIIKTTLVWNFSLSKMPFALLIYPILWFIKKINRSKFDEILGAKIELTIVKDLPNYYFEDISTIQCKMISKQLDDLHVKIKKRIRKVSEITDIAQKILGTSLTPSVFDTNNVRKNTYWQLVIPVNNLLKSRDALFSMGVETGATNLLNLASLQGIELKSAKRLKENFIFIPIHENISMKKYNMIFTRLKGIYSSSIQS
jgi:dTDP-4-amino-4,6-dideoxygalactose transaminase